MAAGTARAARSSSPACSPRRHPHELRLSFDHIWVDYPGKQPNALENDAVALAGRNDGKFFLRWPSDLSLANEWRAQTGIYWTPMPASRRMLLLAGLTFIPFWNVLARRSRHGLTAAASVASLRCRCSSVANDCRAVEGPDHDHRQQNERGEHRDADREERARRQVSQDLDDAHLGPFCCRSPVSAQPSGQSMSPGVFRPYG